MRKVMKIFLCVLNIIAFTGCASNIAVVHFKPEKDSAIKIGFDYPTGWKKNIRDKDTNNAIILDMGIPKSSSDSNETVGGIYIISLGEVESEEQFNGIIQERLLKKDIVRRKGEYTFDRIQINSYPAYKLKYKVKPEHLPGIVFETLDVEEYFLFVNEYVYRVALSIPEANYDSVGKEFYRFLESIHPVK